LHALSGKIKKDTEAVTGALPFQKVHFFLPKGCILVLQLYTLQILGCFNPNLGQIWTNPKVGLKMSLKNITQWLGLSTTQSVPFECIFIKSLFATSNVPF